MGLGVAAHGSFDLKRKETWGLPPDRNGELHRELTFRRHERKILFIEGKLVKYSKRSSEWYRVRKGLGLFWVEF